MHFDDEVFRIFADMDLADEVAQISRPIPGMRLTDPKHRVLAEINRDATQHGYPQANMFDQPELERVLRSALADCRPSSCAAGSTWPRSPRNPAGPARCGSVTAPPTRSRAPVAVRCRRCGPTTCSAPTGR